MTHTRDARFPDKANAAFTVENRGSGSCAIGAFPTVTFTKDGTAVPATVTTNGTGHGIRRLGPGKKAEFQLVWRTSSGCAEADGIVIGLAPHAPALAVPAVDVTTRGSRNLAFCGGTVVVTDVVATP